MKKWEYKTLKADRESYKGFFKGIKDDKFEADLNELGREGWEFVGQGLNAVSYTHLTLPTNREV